jgi:asparagine N-glycosylation enzyme membrane subunit Stt3
MAVFGLACVWLTFEIGKRISNHVCGFIAALLVGLSPFSRCTHSSSA